MTFLIFLLLLFLLFVINKDYSSMCTTMLHCTEPGQRERVDRSLVPSHIHVVASGGGRRTSATGPRGAGPPRGAPSRGHRMPQPMIPTGINQRAPAPSTRPPTHVQAPTGQTQTPPASICCGLVAQHAAGSTTTLYMFVH